MKKLSHHLAVHGSNSFGVDVILDSDADSITHISTTH